MLWFPEQQAKIEQNFQVISQSKLVYEHIYQILLRYLKYYNHSNKAEDYQTVLQILTQLEDDFLPGDEQELDDQKRQC
ncbi:hypothetical protein [Spiroplasma endosymbiont of Sarcophaga carnaria]|uniref:hypothetical protein n=1 Tax=Spiroplasma endosymbiont of Sarcophaga carnaria TaxID=3066303 RepID=UPI0030CA6BAA